MGARGRKSGADLSVVHAGVASIQRPPAPDDISDEQADEWRAIVSRLPADWFPRETHSLLKQYCRHVVAARRVAQLIEHAEAGEAFDVDKYDKLLKMQQREGRAMSSLATRMRITQQATYDPKRKKGSQTRKPWDRPEIDD